MRHLKYNFNTGDIIGGSQLTYIKEVENRVALSGRVSRMIQAQCFCGNVFNTTLSSVISRHTNSCGCLQRAAASQNKKHGMWQSSIYNKWGHIKMRTGNPNDSNYHNYGGRGIVMFPPWTVDFQLFYDYVSALPHYGEKGYTLDRIENDGNYEPGNLRWTTRHIQNSNNRKKPNTTSGYVGVGKTYKRWRAYVGRKRLGSWKTKEEALAARNNYILENNLTEYKIQEARL